ncbi:beta-ketoacyl synthase N-terminal-like domain-containing protein [Bacillus velezensis]|nr:beta-ketoacyl synthase N-terminal-like domain-containing protein [Bacillus velezensis]QMT25920.1 KR domain-containing protein [Bacillus velezensis]
MFAEFLDGMLMIPLLLALKENGLFSSKDRLNEAEFSKLKPVVREEIISLFITQDWLSDNDGEIQFTDAGRFIVDRIFITATVASYKPMLSNIYDVIFGDCKSVFERDQSDHELHVDRTLNVLGSGFQHKKYFSDMEEMILPIFNQEPISEQPRYIADMGCGDGTLLRKIYTIIKNKSLRGKALEQYPIKLLGIDFNEKALQETTKTLKGIDHIVLKGNINDPEKMIVDLIKIGIHDTDNILHIRSFLDHDRPYLPPVDISAADERSTISSEAVYVDKTGNSIPENFVMQSLVEHLNRWSAVVGKHGLIVLEVHCLEPMTIGKFIDKCESLHFDAYHRFSQQLLVKADTFLMAAAEIGLFPKPDTCNKYPKTLPFGRITLNHFMRREYCVRYAQEKDLPALELLEKKCWEQGMQTPASVLRDRIKSYPEGQLVLELDNQVVGAIYSQRIVNTGDVMLHSMETVETLHRKDGTTIQLLGLNILPEMQHRGLGDQLLEFMLQRCSLMDGIASVAGVSRCKDYHNHTNIPLEEYIKLRNDQGRLIDKTLRFHQMHGAQIKKLVPNFRNHDRNNAGYGVLISYDITNRKRSILQVNSKNAEGINENKNKRNQSIQHFIENAIKTILGNTKEEGFFFERPLMEMGLDSADLLELNEQISYQYQIPFKPTFFFKYNTAERIVSYLQEHVDIEVVAVNDMKETNTSNQGVKPVHVTSNSKPNVSENSKDVAIIGISCRLPGGIDDPEHLWELLKEGKDVIGKMPLERWIWPESIDLENQHKGINMGGFLEDITHFDASFFRISPKEAELMDPQQRILLELSWGCIEDAGYSTKALSGSKTGVFIGASGSDYNRLLDKKLDEIEAHSGIGVSMAAMANRISYFYDMHGPSLQMDTACSSSLIAVHEAVKSMQRGECKQALVGGIHVMCYPSNSIAYYKAGMLSKEGKCKTFDQDANGYVRGEGAVMLLLKPLEQALRDQDSIYAVIKGSVTNHGGQSGGLTVPNPEKQADLLVEAYQTTHIEPETVSYVEVHGTGTPLGDPIEINGLKDAFSKLSKGKVENQEPYCGLGSIKTNIGHLEAAAGITGVLKVVLSMRHQMLPASLNFNQLNPHIDLSKTPFYIVNQNRPWTLAKGQSVRRAGVSSFGSGGANAHVVLEEAPGVTSQTKTNLPSYLICLSAKTEKALQQRELDLLSWLEKEGQQFHLKDISATLLLGRDQFEMRSSFVVKDVQELQDRLKEVQKKGHVEGYLRESKQEEKNQIDPLLEQVGRTLLTELYTNEVQDAIVYDKKLNELADLYVKGYDLDWKSLFRNVSVSRISLPTYPFSKERYWLSGDNIHKERERTMRFLTKQWEHVPVNSTKSWNQTIAILKTNETEELAYELAQHIPDYRIIDFHDLTSHLTQSEEEWKRYDGVIDLIGCGTNIIDSLEWIPWLQRLIEFGHRKRLMLLGVTKGLESYQNTAINLSGATRAGLYRMLQSEYGYIRSRHMDVEPTMDDRSLAKQIASEFFTDNEDAEICYRNGERYRAYLQEHQTGEFKDKKIKFPQDQVLWITGGTRGLGLLCARHFVKNYGVKRLVLTGREALPPKEQWDSYLRENTSISKKIQAIQDLEAQGAQVHVLDISLANEMKVQQSLQEMKRILGPIGGVIHCAGIDDQENPAFIRKPINRIQHVLEPKITGLDILYKSLSNEPLQFFMLFSSVSSIIPTLASGKSDYAVANAYMDYFAESNNDCCPIVSIQWPNWKSTGMGEVKSKAYQQTGLLSHTNTEGLQMLDGILSKKIAPVVLPAVVQTDLWKPHQLQKRRNHETSSGIQAQLSEPNKSTNSSAEDLVDMTQTWLISLFSKELKIDPSNFGVKESFGDFGVDSIFLAQILRSINQRINTDIDPSITYEYPTIELLTEWLIRKYSSSLIKAFHPVKDTLSSEVTNHRESRTVMKEERKKAYSKKQNPSDIAVIGLSCRFPGANNIAEYWKLLSEGRSAIRPVPQQRWGYSSSFYAGLLERIRDFDPNFFLIPENDVKAMDPQALVLLEETLKLWYHAGYTHQEMKGKSVGVYLGGRSQHRPNESRLLQAMNPIVAYGQNYLAANISQFFDLRGPSLVLDTACSSALVVMQMAIQALSSGEIESAVVGGVSLLNTDETHRIFQQRGILNPGSSFHAFDQRANGVVLGEGVGMVLLKTVDQALEDGDQIYCVIKAAAINNDGRTAGPATPNIQSQKEVMQTALNKSGKKAEEISFVEANASGTEVTDLLELKAIQSIYRSDSTSPLGLGSIKPNVGHPLCAEGIASFIKVVLMLHHRQIVPFLSGEQVPKHYDLESSPFDFCRKSSDWNNTPRVAAINCFADGGTNAHVILEGWELDPSQHTTRTSIKPPKLDRYEILDTHEKSQAVSLEECDNEIVIKKSFGIDHPILKNHKVYGQSLLPGLAYIDMLYQVFREKGQSYNQLELRKLTIYNPLIVVQDHPIVLSIRCSKKTEQYWQIRVEGQEEHNGSKNSEKKLYVTAEMHHIESLDFEESLNLDEIKSHAKRMIHLDELYERSRGQELVHSGFIKAEGKVYEVDDSTIVDISIGQEALNSQEISMFHPTLIDGSAVGSGLFPAMVEGKPRLFLPLHYESFRATSLLQKHCFTRIQTSSVQQKNELLKLTMEFFDETGKKVAELKQFNNKLVRDAGLIDPSRQKEMTEMIKPQAMKSVSSPSDQLTQESFNREETIEYETFLRQLIADKLQKSADQIDTQAGYYEMGLISRSLLEVITAIEDKTETTLSPTLLFEYTTIAELSAYLGENFSYKSVELDKPSVEQAPISDFEIKADRKSENTDITNNESKEDIAIIGMAGRYPGASDLQQFWTNLKAGKDCISEIPKSRWNWRRFDGLKSPSDKNMSKWGGFIDDPDCFDPQFFRISPREAEMMDPQERLFLEVCWETMENAGYIPKTLVAPKGKNKRRPVGVFAGVMHKDYAFIGSDAASKGQAFSLSLNYAQIPNRVSYFCDFHGPSIAIDTVCSSSLTAVHFALESIRHGECEVALAGGVNLSLHPNKYMSYGMMDLHSSDGYCRTFGKGGDGYVSGEGVGAVLLKPLSKAIQDGDHVYAVVKGSTINHGGTVSGITVPSPVAQADMIAESLEKTGVHPRTISYVEAHGTGTSLGDPIEIQGLEKAYRQYTQDQQFCAIGSVKSNIGHAESAAGISGLHKVALNLHHKTLVPSLHSDELNHYIHFEKSPFYVQSQTEEWKQPIIMENNREVKYPRRAALSSFGATGSNAHVILEEYTPIEMERSKEMVITKDRPAIVPLTAQNSERLVVYAEKLIDFLKNQSSHSEIENRMKEEMAKTRKSLEQKIRRILAKLIHVEEEAIEVDEDWNEYGIDAVQLTAIQLKIQEEFNFKIRMEEQSRYSIAAIVDELLHQQQEAMTTHDSMMLNKEINLTDLAYTLQVGRQALEERVCFIVHNIPELISKLEAFIEQKNPIQHCYQGQAKRNNEMYHLFTTDEDSQELIYQWIVKSKVEKLAKLWTTGIEIDWELLYKGNKPRRISLPTYPFAKERYWVPEFEMNNSEEESLNDIQSNSLSAEQFIKYLQKTWKKSEITRFEELNGDVVIFHNRSTKALAQLIGKQFDNAVLLQAGEYNKNWQKLVKDCLVWVNVADVEECTMSLESIPYLQYLIELSRIKSRMKLIHVTKGLESFQNDDSNMNGAASAGLYRLLQSEYSSVKSRHVDLDPKEEHFELLAQLIVQEIQARSSASEVCYRGGIRYQSILSDLDNSQKERKRINFSDNQVLLVTGGTRGLGMLCAHHMVKHYGVKKLVLTGRENIPDRSEWKHCIQFSESIQEKIRSIQKIEEQGVTVKVLSLPLDEVETIKSQIKAIESSIGHIVGVIHAAGLTDTINPAFIRKDNESIARVLSPKVIGTENLMRCLQPEHLKFVLLFSSVSAVIPMLGAGQSDYAMANSFMDYYAQANSPKLPIVSVQWPSWKETGFGEIKNQAYIDTGLQSITNAEGLSILDNLLQGVHAPVIMPVVIKDQSWLPDHLMNKDNQPVAKKIPVKQEQGYIAIEKTGVDAVQSAISFLQPIFESELKLKPGQLHNDALFSNFGIDSILMAQILQKINRTFDIRIDPSILLEYSTLDSFATWFSQTYLGKLEAIISEEEEPQDDEAHIKTVQAEPIVSPSEQLRMEKKEEVHAAGNEDIAIVGMACRFPDAENLEEYWDLLSKGQSAIRKVPETRWGTKNQYYAGLVDHIYDIDPQFFKLPADDVKAMDPQALVLLEEGLKAIYHAGYSHHDLNGANIGVYIGARTLEGTERSQMEDARNPIRVVGQNYLAANLSQFFNFSGPSVVLDTACSSSLVGLQVASDALKGGSVDAALVGGVTLLNSPYVHDIFSQRKLLQPDGEFHILDRRASGVVLGEGCGVVLVKTLSQAKRDGDKIYALVKGMAVNNDGRTVGPATPNMNAQKEVMKAALQKSGCKPNQIDYLEVNGSGSEVTDLLEIKAIESVYRNQPLEPLFLGSMKPNIGHPLCAKGIASLIKVAMMIEKQSLVPLLSGKEPLEHYSLERANLKLPDKAIQHEIHYAAINCFADGGTNAHVILKHHDMDDYKPTRQPLELPEMNRVDARTLVPINNNVQNAVTEENVLNHSFSKSNVWNDVLSVDHPILKNHIVFDTCMLPGLAWIDLIYQWFAENEFAYRLLKLKNLTIYRPLIVNDSLSVRLHFQAINNGNDRWDIQVTGSDSQGNRGMDETVYVTAEMHRVKPATYTEKAKVVEIPTLARETISIRDIYAEYAHNNLVHKEVMRTNGIVMVGESEYWLHISVDESNQYLFHPALLDGSIVGVSGTLLRKISGNNKLYLPLFYESFYVNEPLGNTCYTRIRHEKTIVTGDLITLSLEYFSSDGRKVGELKNLKIKAVRDQGFIQKNQNLLEQSINVTQQDNKNSSFQSIESRLKSMIASYLNKDEQEIDSHKSHYELGLDSFMLLDMVKRISSLLNMKLSPTLLFEHTTIAMLSEYLRHQYPVEIENTLSKEFTSKLDEPSPKHNATTKEYISTIDSMEGSTTQGYSKVNSNPPIHSFDMKDVAVIGMAGRYSKANNIEEFWKNLCAGVDCITEIPTTRWDSSHFEGIVSPSGKPMSKWGGFIEDVECFDASFFNIPPDEAALMDPQERHFLEVCWEGIENAGYTPENIVMPTGELNRRKVGVFVGVMHHDYGLLQSENSQSTKNIPLSLNASVIANRVSHICNFHGPSMAIDTVCTSSLSAIHLALESIYRGESHIAIAGGVNLSLHPSKYQSYGMLDMHSSDGRCRSFGAGGDGYVSSEGVGVVILKPLDQALKDKDEIYAVIKASAVNHVGKSSGMHVPSPVAQESVIRECLDKTGIDPETIGYMEAHGTGTVLGDSIEVDAMTRAYQKLSQSKGYCALGSVKSNIGHAESAAGISAITRAILQLHNKKLLPSLHNEETNPYLNLDASPFYLPSQGMEWSQENIQKGSVRRAAVHSIGATGSNAHIILEEAPEMKDDCLNEDAGGFLIPVSANSREALNEYIQNLTDFIDANPTLSLSRLAFTLQTGRVACRERLIILVHRLDDIRDHFSAFLNGQQQIPNTWYRKDVEKPEEQGLFDDTEELQRIVSRWMENGKLDKVADLWIKGYPIDWRALYKEIPGRMHLPSYPFAKEKYWVSDGFTGAKNEPIASPLEEEEFEEVSFIRAVGEHSKERSQMHLSRKEKAILFCRKLVSNALNIPLDAVQNEEGFFDMGLSSADIVSMTAKIVDKIDSYILPSRLFDCKNVSELSDYFIHHYPIALDQLIVVKQDGSSFKPADTTNGRNERNQKQEVQALDHKLLNALRRLKDGSMNIDEVLTLIF